MSVIHHNTIYINLYDTPSKHWLRFRTLSYVSVFFDVNHLGSATFQLPFFPCPASLFGSFHSYTTKRASAKRISSILTSVCITQANWWTDGSHCAHTQPCWTKVIGPNSTKIIITSPLSLPRGLKQHGSTWGPFFFYSNPGSTTGNPERTRSQRYGTISSSNRSSDWKMSFKKSLHCQDRSQCFYHFFSILKWKLSLLKNAYCHHLQQSVVKWSKYVLRMILSYFHTIF